jgi:hypothetical protein
MEEGNFGRAEADTAVSPSLIRAASAVFVRTLRLASVAAAVLALVSAASAALPATAALSSGKAGAKHVTLTVSLTTELQCGRLMDSRTLVLTLPAKARIARTVPVAAVTVAGTAVSAVSVAGHAVTISLAAPRGVMCDSIRTGRAKIVLLPAANVVNPATAGTYSVRVLHGTQAYAAPLTIHA